MADKIFRQGECPYCKSEDIEYGSIELGDGDFIYYPCTCNSCGKDFQEHYDLTFFNMLDSNGEEIDESEVQEKEEE